MKFIDTDFLNSQKDSLKTAWADRKPFKYVVFDGILKPDMAEALYRNYPVTDSAKWEYTTYLNQNNKFVKTKFDDLPLFGEVFDELNAQEFLKILEYITGIRQIQPDKKLFGAGLHQSINGAFLDVHVDFNMHEETKYHRRMNLLIYMNKDWKPEYNGYLELWDMQQKKQLEYVEPSFNRCVIFETNEISFHGHPKPLKTPLGVSRKSISVYYYTKERPASEIAKEHNTIYVQTNGKPQAGKYIKTTLKALYERIFLRK